MKGRLIHLRASFATLGRVHVVVRKIAPALALLTLVAAALAADPGTLYRLPGADVSTGGGAITLTYGGRQLTYVQGLGWMNNLDAEPPHVAGDDVLVAPSLLDALGVALPRLDGVRFGGDADVRVVLDVPGLAADALASQEREGDVAAGAALELRLPPMLLPADQPDPYGGIDVTVDPAADATVVRLSGPAFHYRVFPLADPTRLVVDLVPQRAPAVPDLTKELAQGVTYRRFTAPSASGSSVVHVVEVAPGAGEWRVVGESQVPRTLSELADGAFVAINAGYFDTRTFAAVGFLRVDYGLLSLPSRDRATIGFGDGTPVIARLHATVDLHANGRTLVVGRSGVDGVGVATAPGALAGGPRMGVITVQHGVVVENKVGPRAVPEDGFALVYPPDRRDLALVDAGDRVQLQLQLEPSAFDGVRYGVEAGPLLVRDGAAAYDPQVEGFPSGQRILDAVTQQSAIGVRPDGTVLLVVAESMRASDLVPLFLSLGARDAMRLDSGSSATLWADGQVLNRGSERRVVSAIVLVGPSRP